MEAAHTHTVSIDELLRGHAGDAEPSVGRSNHSIAPNLALEASAIAAMRAEAEAAEAAEVADSAIAGALEAAEAAAQAAAQAAAAAEAEKRAQELASAPPANPITKFLEAASPEFIATLAASPLARNALAAHDVRGRLREATEALEAAEAAAVQTIEATSATARTSGSPARKRRNSTLRRTASSKPARGRGW